MSAEPTLFDTMAVSSREELQLPQLYLGMVIPSGEDCAGLWLRADEAGEFELMVFTDGKGVPV